MPVLLASRYAIHAAATSCTPLPLESKTTSSSSRMRPGFRPAARSASSAWTWSFRHGCRAERVIEIAAGGTSLDVIHQDTSTAHQGRSNLVLLRIVGADGGNEASAQVHIVGQDRRFRRCAGDTNVHISHRLAHARRRRGGAR